ncbi:isochorismatase family cysteine hydrolase [Streptomyces sp. NPDC088194]|uniref:cysteine hydrolase family protein n=1 Tax=Streptomyces sp. NPDC088194 TaxID=3154931 RepID=UPI00344ED335
MAESTSTSTSTSADDLSVTSRRTALMLMDYQPAVLTHVPDPEALLKSAQVAMEWARTHDVKVVFVRVAFATEDYDAIPHHHKAFASAKRGRLLPDGDPSLAIHPSLEVRDGDIVVRKTRFGAFSTTDLHALLGDESIDTLVMGGISTAGVVLSTVREASDQDYRIFVLSDATADPDDEVHRVLIEKVLTRQADIITTSELDELFADA